MRDGAGNCVYLFYLNIRIQTKQNKIRIFIYLFIYLFIYSIVAVTLQNI
jgi:hypothetical protein